jgi:hypothetical protein
MQRVIVGALLLSGCSGPDQQFVDLYPVMAVSPQALDFAEVGPPLTKTLAVTISNEGKAKLTVNGELTGSPVFTIDAPIVDLEVGAGDSVEIPVTFTPVTYQGYDGALHLTSDDDEHPEFTVPLNGAGVDLPFPQISIDPATVEIEYAAPGVVVQRSFDITNTGDADLLLGTMWVAGETDEFSIPADFDLSGQTLVPGDTRPMVISYDPASPEGTNALLHVPSNDPFTPEALVLLLGNGGGDWPKPEAMIDCPSEVLLSGPQYTHLSGAQSVDPAGFDPLEYQWTVLARPDGSDEDIPLDPDDLAAIDLYTDVAGDYTVQLVVTNRLGTNSDPAICTFTAKPADAIHVELTWDTPSADVDLHLYEGGYAMFDQPEDCFYCNKNPDWGTNSPDDDPRLDIDDQGGFGPENINVLSPVDGTYEVGVHYFATHGDGPTVATVKVWLDGVEAFTDSRVMDSNDVWHVGTIDMPGATFLPDAAGNTKGSPSCVH